MPDDLFADLPIRPLPPAIENSYDEMPYDSNPFAQSHPSRLFTVGTLFGLQPTPVQRCRVLEIACAAGGNIMPMAESLPDSQFVGIDLSSRQIDDGLQVANQLGLKNLTLKKANILDVDASYGAFDYIIAHGAFSWVPLPVREKILDICAKHLTPNGIAYVSYNTFPGWHMRGMIRDMMRFHSQRFTQPRQRVQQARALLDFLAQSVKQESAYSHLLKTALEHIRTQADYYLFHDYLEDVNEPIYFQQFAEMALHKGLKYLGEARPGMMIMGNFGPEIEKNLRLFAANQIQAEQYMDFLRNRTFRETLLCPAANNPNWSVNPDSLRGLHVACRQRPTTPPAQNAINPTDESPLTFLTSTGANITTTRPLLKNALLLLQEIFPATIPFDALRHHARQRLGTGDPNSQKQAAEDHALLAMWLLNCYLSSDLLELYAMPISFARHAGERPKALSVARLLAARSDIIANCRHEMAMLSKLDRALIPLLDGTHDRPALVEKLTAAVMQGRLTVKRQDTVLTDRNQVQQALASVIDEALANIARMALLTA